MLTRKMLRASAVVSLAGAATFTPTDHAFAVRGGDGGGGGVTPSVSGSEGTGYEVQISVTSESAAPGGGGGDGGGSESWSTQATTTVLPVCFYDHPVPGHAVTKHMEDRYKNAQGNAEKKKRADYVGANDFPDWKKHWTAGCFSDGTCLCFRLPSSGPGNRFRPRSGCDTLGLSEDGHDCISVRSMRQYL